MLFYFFNKNNKEFFKNRIITNPNGGNGCKYTSNNVNQGGYVCCTSFNNQKQYGRRCCVSVDKKNNCSKWSGSY